MFSSCTSRLALVTAVGAVVLAVSAPGASAATSRYVAPTGAGTECSSAKPCKLEDAVKASAAGDEVVAKPGDYYLWAGLQPPAGITIRGVAGQPRPKFLLEAGQLWLTNTTLRYLEVRHQSGTTSPAISAEGTTLDQILIRGPFAGECALSVDDSTVRDSVVIARSDGSAICADALQSSNSTFVRNVTAVAGTGVAIEATAIDSTANVSVSVINTIAKTAPTGIGLYVAGALGAHAKMTASHTYYANYHRSGDLGTVFVDDGDNTSAAPLFVNPAEDDYRQKAGSGTIDAGTYNAANGPFDFDGDPRSIGTTDIGADEFVPPPSPPPSPGDPIPPTPPAGGGTPAPPVGGFAGVKLISNALTLKRGFIVVKLSCPAGAAGPCTGVTKLSARRKRAGSRAARTIGLGRARFSIAAGGRANLKVRVSRPGRRLFAHRHRLRGRAATAAHDATGLAKTTSSRVTIRKGTR